MTFTEIDYDAWKKEQEPLDFNGWLAPNGTFYEIPPKWHLGWAEERAATWGYHGAAPDDELHRRGWIRVHRGYFITGFVQQASEAQQRWAWEHFEQLDADFQTEMRIYAEDGRFPR